MKLIFIYNADSGKLNALFDAAHKLIKPETYRCSLCALTHNAVSEKKAWKTFREKSGLELDFLHKDEFEDKYNMSFEYPVILKDTGKVEPLLNARDISAMPSVEERIKQIEKVTA
ncbi:MAG: GTPase [bacterium]|nr:GTPase [bacterium]